MRLKRRTFLQQAGLAWLTLGVSEIGLSSWADRYLRVLAQPTERKLALLVGIDEYSYTPPLKGCLTDVQLQRELLIHRFGFNPPDILTLTDRQATREGIETAFVEHLVKQAAAGDVVVFHFSGYGSQVKLTQQPTEQGGESSQPAEDWVNSLVPVDSLVSLPETPVRNDLLLDTLKLLWRSLATDKFTAVLDTSYVPSERARQGNLRVRSWPQLAAQISPAALAARESLQRQGNNWGQLKQSLGLLSKLPVTFLFPEQIAAEGTWSGFSAGLFTYTLTQYLWQVTPASTVWLTARRVAETVASYTSQPQKLLVIAQEQKPLLTYYLPPESPLGAEGVVTAVEDSSTVQLKLLGLPAPILENYGTHSCLTLVSSGNGNCGDASPCAPTLLQIRSREGLKAKARFVRQDGTEPEPVQVGQQLQEAIRILPRHLGLTVALAPELERIERVDATSAFANIATVSSVVTAGEKAADCLLAKVKEMPRSSQQDGKVSPEGEQPAVVASYGLLGVGGLLIPQTLGTASESVKVAAERLVPQLNALLAAKLWRLSLNEGSSRLPVKATLARVDGSPQVLVQRETLRSLSLTEARTAKRIPAGSRLSHQLAGSPAEASWPTLPIGTPLQLRWENDGDRPLYVMLLGIDAGGNAITLYSPELAEKSDSSSPEVERKNGSVALEQTLVIPQTSPSFNWTVSAPLGLTEIQIICSHHPFEQTLAALSQRQHFPQGKAQMLELTNPLEVTQALLQDLHEASAVPANLLPSSKEDVYALDVQAWATLPFVYQVVD